MDSLPIPPIVLHLCQQRTEAWRQLRCGRLTASRAYDILPRLRASDEPARHDYLRQLVTEQLTGRPQEQVFVSSAMHRGLVKQDPALAAYAAHTGQRVCVSGFLAHPTLMAGCSLDAHVGGSEYHGVVEVKAPNTVTHLKYATTRRVPRGYRAQIVHQLWMTGAPWADFVSFDDRVPRRWQLVVIRIERDAREVAEYDRCARAFLAEVERQVRTLEALPPLQFFETAPLAIARDVLAQCGQLVKARHAGPVRAPRTLPVARVA
jgi:YqaJ-like recombinase protein